MILTLILILGGHLSRVGRVGRVGLGGRRYRRGAAIRAIGGGKASGTGVRAELEHEAGVEDALGPV